MFEKILVPIDGSTHSLRAVEIAIQIAKKFHGKITLIHVYSAGIAPIEMPEPSRMAGSIPILAPVDYSKVIEAMKKAGNKILEESAKKVEAEEVKVEKLLVEGHVVEKIIKTASEGDFDLIVIGPRGLSKIKQMILGSVSDGVIHHAHCPVLVTK